jgi:hypothetical protein
MVLTYQWLRLTIALAGKIMREVVPGRNLQGIPMICIKRKSNKSRHVLSRSVASVALMTSAPAAFAYLDPGTGSMIIQGLIAAIAMAGVTARMYWSKLQSVLGWGANKSSDDEGNESLQTKETPES